MSYQLPEIRVERSNQSLKKVDDTWVVDGINGEYIHCIVEGLTEHIQYLNNYEDRI